MWARWRGAVAEVGPGAAAAGKARGVHRVQRSPELPLRPLATAPGPQRTPTAPRAPPARAPFPPHHSARQGLPAPRRAPAPRPQSRKAQRPAAPGRAVSSVRRGMIGTSGRKAPWAPMAGPDARAARGGCPRGRAWPLHASWWFRPARSGSRGLRGRGNDRADRGDLLPCRR